MFAWLRLAALVLAMFSGAAGALAEKRVALVIGNNSYVHFDKYHQLEKAVNDADAVGDALEKDHFEVIRGKNLSRAEMLHKLYNLVSRIEPGDTAFFYFAGHGVALGKGNFLLPSDVAVDDGPPDVQELNIASQSIAEADVIADLQHRGARVTIVVLDACRDNPFKHEATMSIGLERGLGQMPEAKGVFSLYSAGFGQSALDRLSDDDPDPNSVFTRVLVPLLTKPGLHLDDLAYEVREEVAKLAATTPGHHEQIPAAYDQIVGGRIYLAGPPPVIPSGPSPVSLGPDEVAWTSIEGSATAQQIAALIQIFPTSRLLPVWERRLAAVTPTPAPVVVGPCGGVTLASLGTRAAGPLSRNEECALKPKDEFRECTDCPAMVVVPKGSFTMGSPANEPGRYDNEGPQHDVTIGRAFAVGKFDVTVDEFKAFVADTGYDAGSSCYIWTGKDVENTPGHSWRNPGFTQTGSDPVACINWDDAQAYAAWVKRRTGQDYRLLSESEWEYAARGQTAPGHYPRYFFGDSEASICKYGNGADKTAKEKIPGSKDWTIFPCSDGYAYTSPAGSFLPNVFALYDMHGNVWRWTEDCYHDSYAGAPRDNTAWTTGSCGRRVLRGGSWVNNPRSLRAAIRSRDAPTVRDSNVGFRVARTLNP